MKLWTLFRETRPMFLPASMVPVFVGASLARYATGRCDWPLFGWTLLGIAAVHGGANVLNDYCDHRSGNDAANTEFVHPFTGGSRLIQEGQLSARAVLRLAIALFAVGALVGLGLAWRAGAGVLALGAVGVLGGVLYSAPPFRLAGRGVGEPLVGLLFGVLPVLGAYYVQTHRFAWEPLLASLPLGVLITAVLFINQFPDYRADRAVGKRNWVVRSGRAHAAGLYAGLAALWAASMAAVVASGLGPRALVFCFAPGLGFLFTVPWTFRYCDNPAKLKPANALTVAICTGVGLLMGLVFLAGT